MTASAGGPVPSITLCSRPGCYIWTAHLHLTGGKIVSMAPRPEGD